MGTKPIYKLGRIQFSVSHNDSAFEQALARLLPREPEPSLATGGTFDVQMGYTYNVARLIKEMVERHVGCIVLSAASLTSPQGFKVLVSGGPLSGKSTLSLALAFGSDWKVLGENITLIDPQSHEIISFPSPFRMTAKTHELLREMQICVPRFILHDWLPIAVERTAIDSRAPFDMAVHLEGEPDGSELVCPRIASSDYLRALLPISNLLKVRDGTEKIAGCLPGETSYRFLNGTVRERINMITDLCDELDRNRTVAASSSNRQTQAED